MSYFKLKKVLMTFVICLSTVLLSVCSVSIFNKLNTLNNNNTQSSTAATSGADYEINGHEKTIKIYTAEGLKYFRDQVNNSVAKNDYGYYGWKIYLCNDIDLKNELWTPIGYYLISDDDRLGFRGEFHGQNHVISNIKIRYNTSDGELTGRNNSIGFFGRIASGANIHNLCLNNVNVEVNSFVGNGPFNHPVRGVGTLVGLATSSFLYNEKDRIQISYCMVINSSVTNSLVTKGNNATCAVITEPPVLSAGGLVGRVGYRVRANNDSVCSYHEQIELSISNCGVQANITANINDGVLYNNNFDQGVVAIGGILGDRIDAGSDMLGFLIDSERGDYKSFYHNTTVSITNSYYAGNIVVNPNANSSTGTDKPFKPRTIAVGGICSLIDKDNTADVSKLEPGSYISLTIKNCFADFNMDCAPLHSYAKTNLKYTVSFQPVFAGVCKSNNAAYEGYAMGFETFTDNKIVFTLGINNNSGHAVSNNSGHAGREFFIWDDYDFDYNCYGCYNNQSDNTGYLTNNSSNIIGDSWVKDGYVGYPILTCFEDRILYIENYSKNTISLKNEDNNKYYLVNICVNKYKTNVLNNDDKMIAFVIDNSFKTESEEQNIINYANKIIDIPSDIREICYGRIEIKGEDNVKTFCLGAKDEYITKIKLNFLPNDKLYSIPLCYYYRGKTYTCRDDNNNYKQETLSVFVKMTTSSTDSKYRSYFNFCLYSTGKNNILSDYIVYGFISFKNVDKDEFIYICTTPTTLDYTLLGLNIKSGEYETYLTSPEDSSNIAISAEPTFTAEFKNKTYSLIYKAGYYKDSDFITLENQNTYLTNKFYQNKNSVDAFSPITALDDEDACVWIKKNESGIEYFSAYQLLNKNKLYNMIVTPTKVSTGYYFSEWQCYSSYHGGYIKIADDEEFYYSDLANNENDQIEIRAVYELTEYNLQLAYSASEDGTAKIRTLKYTILDDIDLTQYDPSGSLTESEQQYLSDNNLSFSSFVVDTQKVISEGWEINDDLTECKFLELSKETYSISYRLLFSVKKIIPYTLESSTYYYVYVDMLLSGSYGNLNDNEFLLNPQADNNYYSLDINLNSLKREITLYTYKSNSENGGTTPERTMTFNNTSFTFNGETTNYNDLSFNSNNQYFLTNDDFFYIQKVSNAYYLYFKIADGFSYKIVEDGSVYNCANGSITLSGEWFVAREDISANPLYARFAPIYNINIANKIVIDNSNKYFNINNGYYYLKTPLNDLKNEITLYTYNSTSENGGTTPERTMKFNNTSFTLDGETKTYQSLGFTNNKCYLVSDDFFYIEKAGDNYYIYFKNASGFRYEIVKDGTVYTFANGKITSYNNGFFDDYEDSTGEITKNDLQGLGGGVIKDGIENEDVIVNKVDDVTTSVTLKVQDSGNYLYPFMSSVVNEDHLAFYKKGNYSESVSASSNKGYYYVYNYGHEISGWVIKIVYANNTKESYLYTEDGWNWQLSNTEIATDISCLIGNNMENLGYITEFIDLVIKDNNATITMYPTWTNVAIGYKLQDESLNKSVARFGDGYELSSSTDILGKSFVYYVDTNNKNNIIPKEGCWNFVKIDKGSYNYDEELKTYIITLNTVYLDNVYKVKLTGAEFNYRLTSDTSIVENKTYYSYDDDAKTYSIVESPMVENIKSYYELDMSSDYLDVRTVDSLENIITCSLTSYSEYKDVVNDRWIENYVNNKLSVEYNNYIESIKKENRSLEVNGVQVLKNVFYCGGEYYIYLANNQEYVMPIFNKPGYDLVLWKNVYESKDGQNTKYAYKTSLYNEDQHKCKLDGYQLKTSDDNIWTLNDGYVFDASNNYEIILNAEYYRKYYSLKLNTMLGDKIGQYGYAKIEIDDQFDNSYDKTYIAIYIDGAMKYFECDSLQNVKNATSVDNLVIYDISTLTITAYDQRNDADSMKTGEYDSMIGYRLASTNTITKNISEISDANEEDYDIAEYTIKDLGINSASTIEIYVAYEEIDYNFSINLSDENSGSLYYVLNGVKSPNSTELTKTLHAGDKLFITYNSQVGYEYKEDAIVLTLKDNNGEPINNGEQIVLKYYNDLKIYTKTYDSSPLSGKTYYIKNDDGSYTPVSSPTEEGISGYYEFTSVNQTFVLEVNGTWLRENLYQYLGDFNTDDQEGLTITENTKPIEFVYKAKVYNSGTKQWIDEIDLGVIGADNKRTVANWQYGDNISVKNAFTKTDNMYIYQATDQNTYAVLSTYAYIVKDPTKTNVLETTYSFPLYNEDKIPTELTITPKELREMINFSYNKILSENNRTIYMVLNVRDLYKINLNLVVDENDTNSTERSSTITNVDNLKNENSVTMLKDGEDNIIFYAKDKENITNSYIYTYYGLINKLTNSYNPIHYSGVEYKLTDVELTTNEFSFYNTSEFNLDKLFENESGIKNTTLNVRFIPKPLDIVINYKVKDNLGEFNFANIEDLINEKPNTLTKFELSPNNEIYTGTEVTISYSLHQDYTMTIVVKGEYINDKGEVELDKQFFVDGEDGTKEITYTTSNYNYEYSLFEICVTVEKKENKNVKFIVKDYDTNEEITTFGALNLSINDVATEFKTNYDYNIVSGRSVKLSIDHIVPGYKLFGYYFKGGIYIPDLDYDNEIINISEFNVNKDNGIYYILFEKLSVNVQLVLDGEQSSDYLLECSNKNATYSNNLLSNAKLGDTIILNNKNVIAERVKSSVVYKDGKLEVLQFENKFNITSELLNNYATITKDESNNDVYNLKIKLDSIKTYTFDVQVIEGNEFIKQISTNPNYKDNDSNVYFDAGTTLTLNIESIATSKYNIEIEYTINGQKYNESADVIEKDFVLNSDIVVKVSVTRKVYEVEINEYHFDTVIELENNTPNKATENAVNNLKVSNYEYGLESSLTVVSKTDKYVLKQFDFVSGEVEFSLKITGNNFELETDNDYVLRHNELQIGGLIFKIIVSEDSLTINYITTDNIELTATYNNIKSITE